MADVAQKAVTANDRKEGTIVSGAMPNGNFASNTDDNNESPTTVSAIETKLTTRLDDPQYYTA